MSKVTSQPNRNELADQYRTQQAERDDLKARHESDIEQLKNNYAHEKASLEDRFEQSIQEERVSHYDQLRNTKKQLQKEERNLEERRKELVSNRQSELYKEQIQTEQDGRARVNEMKQKYAAAEEYERNRALAASDEVRTHHKQTADNIIADSNKRISDLREQKTTELESQKELHAQSIEQIRDHYNGLRSNTEKQYATSFNAIQEHAVNDLEARKLATAMMLQSYSDRQNDPFYRLNRFESNLQDVGDAYVLKVKVPEYERDQFKVQVSGQELQLSGVRTFNEKVQAESGRWISTSSHQAVSERVPLDLPVDGRSMTVQANGEWVEYTIPKYGPNHRISGQYKPHFVIAADEQDKALTKELEFAKTLPKPTIPTKKA